jgi:hypothetical protein
MYMYIYIYVYATCAAKDCHDGARSCGFVPLRCQMLGFEFGRFWKPMPVASWRPMSALIAHLRIRFLVCVGPGRLEVCHRGFLDGVPTTLLAFKLGLAARTIWAFSCWWVPCNFWWHPTPLQSPS